VAEPDAEATKVIAQLEGWGPELVRHIIATRNMPSHLVGIASEWLAKKDQDSFARSEAFQAVQMRTALSAKNAAWIAAIAAIAAAVIAIAGIVITGLAWLWPHSGP
jgi:hypothetical protein